MPKLLQINVSANWGSHGKIAEEIGQNAISQGWESYIAYGRYANASKSKLIKIGNQCDIYQHVFQSRIFDNHGLTSLQATRKFIIDIRNICPDIIHLHNIHGYYINYAQLFDFLCDYRKPVVWTLHDCWPFTGHCAYPVFADCVKWQSHCKAPCPMKREYPESWVKDGSWRNFEKKKQTFLKLNNLHIVTVSRWLEQETRKSFLVDKDIRCIYNGIDTNIFKPNIDTNEIKHRHDVKSDDKVILGVASLWESRKGLFDFYKLRKELPDYVKIILIGLTKKQIEELPKGIVGVERTDSQEQLAAYYNLADVYVNPSYAETFGMTTAEALACGTPSVVYKVTACPEIVNENTGAVVEVGATHDMAAAILGICKKDKGAYKKDCRKRVEENFDKKDSYEKYLNLYKNLIQGSKKC